MKKDELEIKKNLKEMEEPIVPEEKPNGYPTFGEDKEKAKKFLRINVEENKILKDMRDINIEVLKKKMDEDYYNQSLKDEIAEIKDLVKRNKIKLEDGKELDATPSEIILLKVKQYELEQYLKKEITLRQAKTVLRKKELSKETNDSYESVIKDIEENIKKIDRNHENEPNHEYIQ